MPSIVIKLNPEKLANPNLDIRYVLPDLIVAKTGGVAIDDGYDYAGERTDMYLFLSTQDLATSLNAVLGLIENEIILGNDLRSVAQVGIVDGGRFEAVYPPGRTFTLPPELDLVD